MNLFWAVLLLAVVVSAVSAREDWRYDEHNIIKCDTTGDQSTWKILDFQTVEAEGIPSEVVERTITYPRDGTGKYEIVCIRVLDQIGDGTGGHPIIRDGGLGFRYVTMHFKSQRSHGLEFTVQIWGKDPEAGGP